MSLTGPIDELPVIVVREPGRSPLVIVVHENLEVGRDGSGLLIDDPRALNYATVPERLSKSFVDPWADIDRAARALTKEMEHKLGIRV